VIEALVYNHGGSLEWEGSAREREYRCTPLSSRHKRLVPLSAVAIGLLGTVLFKPPGNDAGLGSRVLGGEILDRGGLMSDFVFAARRVTKGAEKHVGP
jgi:hypothetical protein